jgi:predicted AlkP superfamily phosphohydrolase/phosphomutase
MKVLVIGLDGVTLDLLGPWIEAGELPNLQRLMKQGASGRLRSTLPPISSSSWSSFATGVNPGKHGLVDFVFPGA